MPTPNHVFNEIAARHGVDPADDEAVDVFYEETLATLPEETRKSILDELLARDGEEAP